MRGDGRNWRMSEITYYLPSVIERIETNMKKTFSQNCKPAMNWFSFGEG